MKAIKIISIGICFLLSLACEVDSNCGSINVDYVTFSTHTVDEDGEEQIAEFSYDSIRSPQANVTFVQDTAVESVSSFALPLDPGGTQTDFYFYYDDKTDTVVFSYNKISSVDSPECGVDAEYIGLDTVFQSFDSLIIVNDTLKRTINETNIKLYI